MRSIANLAVLLAAVVGCSGAPPPPTPTGTLLPAVTSSPTPAPAPPATAAPTAASTATPTLAPTPSPPAATPDTGPTVIAMTQSQGDPPLGFFPSVIRVDSGTAVFDLRNSTEGPHNMVIGVVGAQPGGEALATSATLQSATSFLFTVDGLAAGTYPFWCSIDEHYNFGMVGQLTVTP